LLPLMISNLQQIFSVSRPKHSGFKPSMHEHLTILSGRANPDLSREIAAYLGIGLGHIEVGNFPDGEISVKLNQNIRGCDVFLVQPTCPPVNENLVELLVLIDACRRASAARITAVMPYFGYARQDRKDSGRVPITSKLVANLIVQAGRPSSAHHGPARRADSGVLRCACGSSLCCSDS
jgi:phosphoribosylpyrophosphate synthetase